jgi:glucuronate isomerase
MATLTVHPDRLLPTEPGERGVARRLYAAVRDLPIVSPHGHVDPRILLDDPPFADPTSLLVQPDHYVTRLLHAGGVRLDRLGVAEGPVPEERAREAWRLLCRNWHLLRGTPVRYWLDSELVEIFGVRERPDADNADALYDQIAERLAGSEHRPRTLLRRFGIDVLATTDDPGDDLVAHARLAEDPRIATRVAPTFRPDRYLEPARPDWAAAVKLHGVLADTDVGDYAGYVAALEERRRFFVARGAVSADHSQIPAPHDMSRRLDAGFLAGLVAAHRLDEDEALDTLTTLVVDQPRKVFKL